MTQTELTAFEGQVNLELLDDIISFAVHTAEPDWRKRDDLKRRCIFPNQTVDVDALQRKYGFLYLGELLERYEERFGMSVPDRRAIALALGYTREITTEKMFVGTQLADFIRTAAQNAKLKPIEFVIFSYLCYCSTHGQGDKLTLEVIAEGVCLSMTTVKSMWPVSWIEGSSLLG